MIIKNHYLLLICSVVMLNGCTANSLLPSIQQTSESPWQSFAEAKESYDRIEVEITTREELKNLGYDPFETPNVRLIDYLEVTRRFIPNASITVDSLPIGVQNCLSVKQHCQGYEVTPKYINRERYGNPLSDLLNFRRRTVTSGWTFEALIVLQDELVVYKLWNGEPKVLEFEDKKNPLGPLQDIERFIDF